MASTEYQGIYLPGDDKEPVALFKDADVAQRYRVGTYGTDRGVVVPVQVTAKQDADIAAILEPQMAPAPAAVTPDPDEEMKAAIRAELTEQERRERLTKEVQAEMKAAAKGEQGGGS